MQWCDFWFPEDQLLQKAWHKRNNIIDLTDGSAILTCNVVVGGLDRFNFNDLVAVENNQSWCIVSFEPVWGEYSVFLQVIIYVIIMCTDLRFIFKTIIPRLIKKVHF